MMAKRPAGTATGQRLCRTSTAPSDVNTICALSKVLIVRLDRAFYQPFGPIHMSDIPAPVLFDAAASGSTKKAGQTVDEGQGRIFPCESCGADLKFHIGQQHLKCPFCGFETELQFADNAKIEEQDFRAMLARLQELRQSDRHPDEEQKQVRCESCGGTTAFYGSLTSSECPFCGSPIQLENVHAAAHRVPVDGVLPFQIERETARTNLGRWIKSRWFAPNEFLRRGVNGKFNGVYLPFWTYDTLTLNRYSGERGEHYWVSETYTDGQGKTKTRRVRRTRWYPTSGNFQRFFDDVLVMATEGLSRELIQNLEPWPLGQCVPFTQQVLAGYLARTYEVKLDQGFPIAQERIDVAIRCEVQRRIGGDEQRISSIDTQHGALTFKHLLLPLWLLAYRYGDHTYQVFVNAGTGEVQGERPYSLVKITLVVLAGLGVAAVLALLLSR